MTSLFQAKLNNAITKINDLMFVDQSIQTNVRTLSFKYVEKIGKGTFGFVVKIEENENGNIFALKTVYEDNKHYYREKEILENLKNRHFVRLFEYAYFEESTEGRYVQLVLEYLPFSLRNLIVSDRFDFLKKFYEEKENFRDEMVKDFLRQGFEGLSYLHSFDIAHRDIKPANILIDYDGTLKFCDLGSAKKLETKSNTTYICSRYYRAPENIIGLKNYSTKIDIWSFALSIAEIITKKVIFRGQSNVNQLEKILSLLKISQKDLLFMKLRRNKRETMGIKKYMRRYTNNKRLVEVFDKTIKFNSNKRRNAKQALEMELFKKPRE
ncbi:CMGC/GSK protein kinase [Vavraia culicis subsp. floridensis]|uniref:CMGC/GSK protein kinase n=1 Tax=Vavraia culicis (isolate floridensis) TaxID=948595 RepID=L2GWH3_VAVCU|nr:CMGC/GSK protein kinase [Vavraia culicis subsp. floridensis]ELA48021.1 CMGC/GSK protein kinase [Vavraia culicis subsp. floridensis]